MPRLCPYGKILMIPTYFPHRHPDGSLQEPTWAIGVYPYGSHVNLGCKILGAPYWHSHEEPTLDAQVMPIWGNPHDSHIFPTYICPDGSLQKPTWAIGVGPYGSHVNLGCKILGAPYGHTHVGPMMKPHTKPIWDNPHSAHIFTTYVAQMGPTRNPYVLFGIAHMGPM